jgi:TPR repeat protein
MCYHYGKGVVRDRAEAERWYQLAAAQGDKSASEALERLRKRTSERG